jgi:uncharacterized membrane protein
MAASKIGNRRRKADTIILSAAGIILFCVLVFSSLFSTMDSYYFDYAFEKYGVYGRFNKEMANQANENIIGFLNHKAELDKGFLNGNEISHLEDVKNILDSVKIIYYISLILLFIFLLLYGHDILKVSAAVFAVLAVLLLISLTVGFDFLFLKFHHLFFTGNYAFDPDVSNMKALYPDGLFMFFSQVFYLKALIKSILLALSWKYLYSSK